MVKVTRTVSSYENMTFADLHLLTYLRANDITMAMIGGPPRDLLFAGKMDDVYTCRKATKRMASWVKGRQKIEPNYVGKVLLTNFAKGIKYYTLFGVIEEWDGQETGELVKQYETVQEHRRRTWPYGARLIDKGRAELVLRNMGIGLALKGEPKLDARHREWMGKKGR